MTMKVLYKQILKFFIYFLLLLPIQVTNSLLRCQTFIEKPELVIQSGHLGYINSMAFSPDGRLLASASRDETVKIWEPTSALLIHTLPGNTGSVYSIAFSSDGQWLAAGGEDGVISVWETSRYKLIYKFHYTNGRVNTVVFSPDSKLIMGNLGYYIVLWDLVSGKLVSTLHSTLRYRRNNYNVSAPASSSAYSSDGKWFASGGNMADAYIITIWEVNSGQIVKTLEEPGEKGRSYDLFLSFSSNRRWLAASVHGKTKIWKTDSWQQVYTLDASGHLAYSPNSQFLVIASGNSIRIFEAESALQLQTITSPSGWFGPIAFSPGSKWLASANADYAINYWTLDGQLVLSSTNPKRLQVEALTISSNGRWLALDTDGGYGIKVFDLTTGKLDYAMEGGGYTARLVFSPNNRWLASNKGSWVEIIDTNTGQKVHKLIGHLDAVDALAFSPDGGLLASTDRDGTIKIWDSESGTLIRSIDDSLDTASSISFSPDGRWFATASSSAIKIRDSNAGQLVRKIESSGRADGIGFSPDGKYIVSKNWSEIKIWDVNNANLKHILKGHSKTVNSLAYSPDGKWLVSASDDNTIKLWEPNTGKLILTLQGHYGSVKSLAFYPNGKFLLSGGSGSDIKLWETEHWTNLATLNCFNVIDWICFTPEGYYDFSKGIAKLITWRIGNKIYLKEKYFDNFYQSGLLAKIINGEWNSNTIGIRKSFAPPPEIAIEYPKHGSQLTKEQTLVKVQIKNLGGGIGEIRLFHNGKSIKSLFLNKSDTLLNDTVTQNFNLKLFEGLNVLHVRGFNSDNNKFNAYETTVLRNTFEGKSDIYLLVVGINKYRNPDLSLNYARTDAQEFTQFWLSENKSQFNSIIVQELFDEQANRESIRETFRKIIKKAKLHDLIVVLLAGHGEVIDNQFYYLTYETTSMNDNEHLKEIGISAKELGKFLTDLKSQKKLVFLDACKSGQALLDLGNIEEQQSLEEQARFSGIYILASSKESQIAGEVEQLGHGIFTYSLLEGIRGQGDILPQDGKITVEELFSFVKRRVPELAKKFGKNEQLAVSDTKRAIDFYIRVR